VGFGLQEGGEGACPLPLDPNRNYGPAEVCDFLNVSYSTAIRVMERMPGCVKIVKKTPGKRTKRTLRISGARLKEWMRNHPANPLA
jgi:hypothetical protein